MIASTFWVVGIIATMKLNIWASIAYMGITWIVATKIEGERNGK